MTILRSMAAAAIMLAAALPAAAQTPPGAPPPSAPGRISGVVKDLEGRPLETVAITVRAASDSSLVTGALTERNGRFRIDGLAPGRYLLRVSLIGYLPRSSETIELTAAEPAIDLGTIGLDVTPVELDAVEAVAERGGIVVEADRTIYNTASMPIASSGTATDVLRAVPELEVDVNNNVKLRGNQAAAIHINGRPTPMRGEQLANFLQQLPGDRIARVEVLPNPSARHDPEGMGGIVNIVLKENLDLGLSGSASANASTRNRQYASGRLNVQRGRLTLFSGAGLNTYQQAFSNQDVRQNLVADPVTVIEQNSTTDNRSRGWNADWTAELKVGRQATLWSNAWMYSSNSDMVGLTEYGIFEAAQQMRERYDRRNDSGHTWGNYNFGVGFKQVFQPQHEELTIDARYTNGINDSESSHMRIFHAVNGSPAELPPELTLNDIDAGNGTLSIQADYNRPLRGGRLETGLRSWRRDQHNDNVLRIFATAEDVDPRERVQSGYDYEEVVHSLYATYARSFGRFGLQGGLRAERTTTRFESGVVDASFERDYHTLFPSFNVSYTPRQSQTLRLLYSKRIARPNPFYLDPFVPPTDPLNRFFGNPDLRPSYTQSLTLDYTMNGSRGTVRVAPYYRHTTDVWERIRTVDSDGVATSRWENALSARAFGSNLTFSLRPAGRVSGTTNFNVYRDVRDGSNIGSGYRRSGFMWSMGGNVGVKLTPTLTVQAFGNHFPTQSILQGRASGYTFTSVALRQQVWGTKGTVSLNVSDPLGLYRYTSSTSDPTYVQNSRSSSTMRVATLGFTYNFGKPPQQQSRRQQGGEEAAGETIRVR